MNESSEGAGEQSPGKKSTNTRTHVKAIRFKRTPDVFREIVRAARKRGVKPATYIQERALQCARAEIAGARVLELGPLQP